jgi:hypothetical protein
VVGFRGVLRHALNRANVVLIDIRRLLSLRLTPDTTATKFISDFRVCLQRLRKNNARISDDTDTLLALLLVAIQDDNFEIVRDSMVHKPDMGEDTILMELREREKSLMMKDQASHIGGDSRTSILRYSPRMQQTQSPGTRGRSGETYASSSQKWNIPKYPDSWRLGFGASHLKYFWRGAMMPTRAVLRPTYQTSTLFLSCLLNKIVESPREANKSCLLLTVHLPQVLQTATTRRLLEIEADPMLRVRVFDFRRVVALLPNEVHDWWQRSPSYDQSAA